MRTGGTETFMKGGLWVADLETRQRQRLLPDFLMLRYNISPDGKRVAFTAVDEKGAHSPGAGILSGYPSPVRRNALRDEERCWDDFL
jgi:hypothetical protein